MPTVTALIVVAIVIVSGTLVIAITNSSSTSLSSVTSNNTSLPANNYTNTETTVSNYATISSAAVKTSETACIPYSGYVSTSTLSEQSTTMTMQVVYEGTSCSFGDNIFEAPSAILIPANTFVWTNFQLQENGSYYVGVSIDFLAFPEVAGDNITVAVYRNSNLIANSTTPVQGGIFETNSSFFPPSNSSSNSVFALSGVIPTVGVGTQTGSPVNLNGTTITVAFVSDKPLWLSGWTPEDMSKGTGPQFGESVGQLSGTYEWPDSGLSLPSSLPQPASTIQFELEIPGSYS